MKLKGLVATLLVLFSSGSYGHSIVVTGLGHDGEGARHDAYRKAIEFKIGTVIVSEKESQNYQLLKNKILAHSAGYITKMRILNESVVDGIYRIEMEVEVSSSKLADMILSDGKTTQMNAELDYARVSSFMHQKDTGDTLLRNILKEYPYRAYKITHDNYEIKYDTNRNIIFSIPYDLTWNYKFLSALSETLNQTQDGSSGLFHRSPSQITMIHKNPEDFLIGKTERFSFNDDFTVNALYNRIVSDEPRIRLRILNKEGKSIVDECVIPEFLQGHSSAFYSSGDPYNFKIYGNNVNKSVLRLAIHNHHRSLLNDFYKVKLQMTSKINCKL